jgi:antitoxin component of MazEF toxin-antitoxin module
MTIAHRVKVVHAGAAVVIEAACLVRTNVPYCTNMEKRLTKTGNSLALILDRDLLERTGISAETTLEVSTDGDVIVISPTRTKKHSEKLRQAMTRADQRYAGVFRRLAK